MILMKWMHILYDHTNDIVKYILSNNNIYFQKFLKEHQYTKRLIN